MKKILLMSDSQDILAQLRSGLANPPYTLLEARDLPEALAQFKHHLPPVVLLDLDPPAALSPVSEGVRCLEAMLRIRPLTKAIILIAPEQRELAYQTMRSGAYDFCEKPVELADLRVIVAHAFHLSQIENENRRLEDELNRKTFGMEGILGDCKEMQKVFSDIRRVATTDVPVLITGESGTGKELVAKALHDCSQRAHGRFVPINCSAIPENLLESELFGAEKGAFTGACCRVQGKVEYADQGTLFLDEIGELPLTLQVKLLRFLQEKVLQRVGGREQIAVDSRVIAATNLDIARAMGEARFRDDLYYRIAVVTIELPPLRRRGQDLRLLANYFLQKSAQAFHKNIVGFSSDAFSAMESHCWPGNVRELQNRVQRAVIMSDSAVLEPEALGLAPGLYSDDTLHLRGDMTLREARQSAEREILIRTLKRQKGNVMKASETLGISRPTLYELMKKHDIKNHPAEQ